MTNESYVPLPLAGRRISQLRFDYAFGLEISDESERFSIRVNTKFTLTSASGSSEYDPEQIQACGPALKLFNAYVTAAKAFHSGRLEITFSDGMFLRVDSHSQFEAWEAVGSNGMRVVAVPGGELAIWQSNSSPAG